MNSRVTNAERAKLLEGILSLIPEQRHETPPNREKQDAETAEILAHVLPLLKEIKEIIFEHRKSFELMRYKFLIDDLNLFEYAYPKFMKQHDFGRRYSRKALFTLAPFLEEDLIEIYNEGHEYRAVRVKEEEAKAEKLLLDITRVEREKELVEGCL